MPVTGFTDNLSLSSYINAAKQRLGYTKTTTRTTIAALPFSLFDLAGSPAAGALAGASSAAGIVPVDTDAGYMPITDFGVGTTGKLSRIEFSNTVACRMQLYDRLFVAGAYSFNSNVVLAAQPSFASRVPNADYKGLELWVECVTAFTGNLSLVVTYTNQAGTTGRTTGVVATAVAGTIGRMIQIPLASGDTGIMKVESVVASVATVGTFNLCILRPLGTVRVPVVAGGGVQSFIETGLPQVYSDSALYVIMFADSTSSGAPYLGIEVASY